VTTAFNWKPEPTLLEQLIALAQQQGRSPEAIVTQAVISYLHQTSSSDRSVTPSLLRDRRAFLKLPLEERRRILHTQAETLITHYQNDSEWRELSPFSLLKVFSVAGQSQQC
jgi:hypothetical protein